MREKVSVIIPTYNREKQIGRAIRSVLSQTYEDYELIIVDDGSTDHTKEIVEQFMDDRIQYICLETNRGACYARNVGIQSSQYAYIAFLDSDDEWMPDKLRLQMEKILNSPQNVGLVYCRMSGIQRNGTNRYYTPAYECPEDLLEGDMFRFLLWRNFIGTPTMLIRKECLEEVGGFKESLPCLQDYELVLRIAKEWQIGFVDEVLVEVYKTDNSLSTRVAERLVVQCYLISKYRREMTEFGILPLVQEQIRDLARRGGIQDEIEELMCRDFEL